MDNACSLREFAADMIGNVPLRDEMHRFIPAMTSIARGNEMRSVDVTLRPAAEALQI